MEGAECTDPVTFMFWCDGEDRVSGEAVPPVLRLQLDPQLIQLLTGEMVKLLQP